MKLPKWEVLKVHYPVLEAGIVFKNIVLVFANLLVASCTQATPHSCGSSSESDELLDFAKANCFFLVLQKDEL